MNVVRLGVRDWAAVGLEDALRPVTNDIVLTGKGSSLHRFTWSSAACGLQWTREAEDALVAACQRVSDEIRRVC